MRGPFRSEVEAYHFLLLTVAAFAAIALAGLLGGIAAGVPVWAVLTAGAALYYLRRRSARPIKTAPAHVGAEDERRILVLAREAVADDRLVHEIERAAAGRRAQVLIVCPVFSSAVRRWTSDLDGGRARAQQGLDECLAQLRSAGIVASGQIGDEDPLQAIEDALRTFGADEIIISTRREERTSRRERDPVAAARERFALPIAHLAIDAER